jgi:hypothetical protein
MIGVAGRRAGRPPKFPPPPDRFSSSRNTTGCKSTAPSSTSSKAAPPKNSRSAHLGRDQIRTGGAMGRLQCGPEPSPTQRWSKRRTAASLSRWERWKPCFAAEPNSPLPPGEACSRALHQQRGAGEGWCRKHAVR